MKTMITLPFHLMAVLLTLALDGFSDNLPHLRLATEAINTYLAR
jgi:hypothetical protein